MILDIAAGVLIAAAIVGMVQFGSLMADEGMRSGQGRGAGFTVMALGLLAGAVLVAWRLFR